MPINQRYYVVKNKDEQSITYFEYDKMNGLSITPKKNVRIKDAINVNKMVIINPTFAQNLQLNKFCTTSYSLKSNFCVLPSGLDITIVPVFL